MKSSEYDMLRPDEGPVSLEESKPNYNAFISGLLSNPSTTKEDRERIVALLLKERDKGFVTEEQVRLMIEEYSGKKKSGTRFSDNRDLNPKSTADFMSLFEKRDVLKYLTHNYDNSTMTLETMLTQAKTVFKEQAKAISIPKQLWALINNFLNGGEWVDYKDVKCHDGYSTQSWLDWSANNENIHPITDIGGMEDIIQRFKHTIRFYPPYLQSMVNEITKPFEKKSFKFESKYLEKADFYTHVSYIKWRMVEIIKDLADHSDNKEINIEYLPGIDGDYHTRKIKITQKGSYSAKGIDEVIQRFNSGAGSFAENADKLRGYCHWSVESLWDGKPYRWNILSDTSTEIKEEIDEKSVAGFAHILTFYFREIEN